jgi:hypothetical protein
MYQTNEKITQSHQDSMASIHAFGKKAVESTHNLAQTQFDASKEFIAKTQEKMMEFGKQKDPKDLMPVFTTQGFQEASTDLMAYQATLTAALRKNHHEIMEKADDAFDDAKKHLQELVEGAISKAPQGSEAYTSSFKMVFEAALHGYDQVRSSVHNAYAHFGNTVDTAMTSHNQDTQKGAKKHKTVDVE